MKPEETFPETKDYFNAFIKTAQYITHLTPRQDILTETGNALARFYGASLVGFFEMKNGEVTGHHWILPDGLSPDSVLNDETMKIVRGVFSTGFLETRHIGLPGKYAVAFLPITWENQTTAVMLAGHRTTMAVPDELLDSYLAVAGLVGTAVSTSIAAFGNIAERKRAEEAKALLASIVTSSEDAIYSKTLAGIITSWNAGAEKMYEYTPDEAIGRHVSFLGPAEYTDETESFIAKIRAGERVEHYETTRVKKNGERLSVSLIVSPIRNANDELVGTSTIARDITAQKQTETALASANKKLNILSSITRHDVLNQLTAIEGYLELSHERCQEDAKEQLYFERQMKSINLIEYLLLFTKSYEELGVKAPAWQRVTGVVATAQASFGGIRFSTGTGGLEIFADPLLEKVFFNLFDNALRHGGSVTEIRVSAEFPGDTCIIVVEDNGVGVPAAEKERIFERGVGKNTGLGLFLAREILAITGISIREAGKPGKGARFEIAVPKGASRVCA